MLLGYFAILIFAILLSHPFGLFVAPTLGHFPLVPHDLPELHEHNCVESDESDQGQDGFPEHDQNAVNFEEKGVAEIAQGPVAQRFCGRVGYLGDAQSEWDWSH